MGRVVHFETHADDPERAVAFGGEVFGRRIGKWGGAALAMPKHAVPGAGWSAYIKDPEENFPGMCQTDRNAK